MRKDKCVKYIPLISFLWFFISVLIAASYYKGYNHSFQYISELGAQNAPHAFLVNYLVFMPVSILLGIYVFYALKEYSNNRYVFRGLIGFGIYSVSIFLSALFPCDFRCSFYNPSFFQILHTIIAIIGYVSAITGIFLTSLNFGERRFIKYIGVLFGIIAFLSFANLNPENDYVGLMQRSLELSIFIWLIIFSLSPKSKTTNAAI